MNVNISVPCDVCKEAKETVIMTEKECNCCELRDKNEETVQRKASDTAYHSGTATLLQTKSVRENIMGARHVTSWIFYKYTIIVPTKCTSVY
jgi:hypothetical protein